METFCAHNMYTQPCASSTAIENAYFFKIHIGLKKSSFRLEFLFSNSVNETLAWDTSDTILLNTLQDKYNQASKALLSKWNSTDFP